MLIQQLLENHPAGRTCLICGERRLTYGQMLRQVDEAARSLAAVIQKGDKVLLRLSNPVGQLLTFFAIIKAGGICVFAGASFPGRICRELSAAYDIKHEIADEFTGGGLPAHELPTIAGDDIFLGALSSGTTGAPKALWRDHASWLAAFPEQSRIFGITGDDRLYIAGPLSYTANLNACLHIFFAGGAAGIAGRKLPRGWLKEMAEHKISAVFMAPANYRVLLRVMPSPLENVRSVVSGGAKMDKHTAAKLLEYFPRARIVEYYGASELGHVSYAEARDILARPASVGRLFPGVSVRIVDGLIFVKSPYIVPALRPEATAGDVGELDGEGYLTLYGRAAGVINVAGIKVMPERVEDVLKKCPDISDAAVTGIEDATKGEKICAFVVRRGDKLTKREIVRFCRYNMDQYSCPQKIIFTDALPLNDNGKVDRAALRRLLKDGENG
ncbi:MAG: AMP-binding protein [Acidaminococcales bacterium]|jgi:long-chain acyl-CoA synthetase|nr:AMP-binding protein [Acidaminococcales bacterium]